MTPPTPNTSNTIIPPQTIATSQPSAPKKSFITAQKIEWAIIVGAILILGLGGFFFIYPQFNKFQTIPQNITTGKELYESQLTNYQKTQASLEQYHKILTDYSQDLNIVNKAFWDKFNINDLKSNLDQTGEAYQIKVNNIAERGDLENLFENMKVFDVKLDGSAESALQFKQSFDISLPFLWSVSSTNLSDKEQLITVALLENPTDTQTGVTEFKTDLYSLPKFRIIKESNIDY